MIAVLRRSFTWFVQIESNQGARDLIV